MLIGAAMMPQVEVHNALGRSDMEVHAGNRHWVFEFKYAKDDREADLLLKEAQNQIQARQYACKQPNEELLRVALVFSGENRRFVAWRQIS